jgi:hypothetical protein
MNIIGIQPFWNIPNPPPHLGSFDHFKKNWLRPDFINAFTLYKAKQQGPNRSVVTSNGK